MFRNAIRLNALFTYPVTNAGCSITTSSWLASSELLFCIRSLLRHNIHTDTIVCNIHFTYSTQNRALSRIILKYRISAFLKVDEHSIILMQLQQAELSHITVVILDFRKWCGQSFTLKVLHCKLHSRMHWQFDTAQNEYDSTNPAVCLCQA